MVWQDLHEPNMSLAACGTLLRSVAAFARAVAVRSSLVISAAKTSGSDQISGLARDFHRELRAGAKGHRQLRRRRELEAFALSLDEEPIVRPAIAAFAAAIGEEIGRAHV